jgi:hypothetical protein
VEQFAKETFHNMSPNDFHCRLIGEFLQLSEMLSCIGGLARQQNDRDLILKAGDCLAVVHTQLLRPTLKKRPDLIPDEWIVWWNQ